MSKTLLDDGIHTISTHGSDSVLRVQWSPYGKGVVPEHAVNITIDKLRTAMRSAHGPRRSWDDHFLDEAALIASRSKDPSTQVGCIIVDTYRRGISSGYNGFARGVADTTTRLNDRAQKYPLTLHAELNAILFAARDLGNATIYVWPSPPCTACASAIIQVGIVRVVSPPASKDMLTRWGEQLKLATAVLLEAGVQQDFIGAAVEV